MEKDDFRNTVTSKALALIRWPLVMCIVAVHVFVPVSVTVGGEVYDVGASSLNMGLWRFVKGFISENGVATFFFISGFLFMTGPAHEPRCVPGESPPGVSTVCWCLM